MEKRNLLLCLAILYGCLAGHAADGADVTLTLNSNSRAATLRNGIVSVYVNADGVFESFLLKDPNGIEANDIQLMNKNNTEVHNKVARGYLSYTSGSTNGELNATETKVVGTSTDDDWYYAQTKDATWLIKYNLDYLPTKPLHLTIATAGAGGSTENKATLKCLSSNGRTKYEFPNGIRQLHDGSVIRSATLAGRDSLFTFEIPANQLVKGENTLSINVWEGNLMYDYIKLEAEEPLTGLSTPRIIATSSKADDTDYYNLLGQRIALPARGIYINKGKKTIIK